jgi:ribosomal protein L11 methyltransferase
MNKPEVWIEVVIPSAAESFGAVENFLFEHGCCGLEEEDDVVRGYFPKDISIEDVQPFLKTYLKSLKALGFSVEDPVFRKIRAQDWNSRWEKNFKPVRVTPQIVIKPPWEEWKPHGEQIVVDITPGMAFGTGTHATTQLSAELLETHLNPSDAVLDVGTGSAILAVVAAKLGADKVLAIDIDEDAVENAKENVVQNRVGHLVEVRLGSVESIGIQAFDLILANIDLATLGHLLPVLKQYAHSSSRLILSGVLATDLSRMETILSCFGYECLEVKCREEWLGFVVRPGKVGGEEEKRIRGSGDQRIRG